MAGAGSRPAHLGSCTGAPVPLPATPRRMNEPARTVRRGRAGRRAAGRSRGARPVPPRCGVPGAGHSGAGCRQCPGDLPLRAAPRGLAGTRPAAGAATPSARARSVAGLRGRRLRAAVPGAQSRRLPANAVATREGFAVPVLK